MTWVTWMKCTTKAEDINETNVSQFENKESQHWQSDSLTD